MLRAEQQNYNEGLSTYAEALFSNPPFFIQKIEKKINSTGLKVLFIGAEFEENDGSSRELLLKMTQAMKLSADDFLIEEIKGEFSEDEKKLVIEEINQKIMTSRPSVVITLGAFASNLLLDGQERLSRIHGNFFPRTLSQDFHTQIVPLFHPGFLLINPSMKKTAWMDMQKIMEFLRIPLA